MNGEPLGELPPPHSLSLAIRKYQNAGGQPERSLSLDSIETNARESRVSLAKFGYKDAKGFDSRVYMLPIGETDGHKTIFTGFTAVGSRQFVISDSDTEGLAHIQKAIAENLIKVGPGLVELTPKRRMGTEKEEIKSLFDTGSVLGQGLNNPDGTEVQIGWFIFRPGGKPELIVKPTPEALQDAVKINMQPNTSISQQSPENDGSSKPKSPSLFSRLRRSKP